MTSPRTAGARCPRRTRTCGRSSRRGPSSSRSAPRVPPWCARSSGGRTQRPAAARRLGTCAAAWETTVGTSAPRASRRRSRARSCRRSTCGRWPAPRSTPLRVLNLGHGAGALPGLMRRAGARVTSVDLDPDVAHVAQCFGYTGDVVVADGRAELARAGSASLDVVTVDVVDSVSGAVPACFATVDFFAEIAAKLRPGGRAVMNVLPAQLPALASAALAVPSWRVEVAQVPPPNANFVLLAVAPLEGQRAKTRDLIPEAGEWVRATQWATLTSAPSDVLTRDATA